MARGPSKEQLEAARREGLRQRLITASMAPDDADAWIDEWARTVAQDGLPDGARYWGAAWGWIAEQRAVRKRP